jgi:ABC-type multidrug transport system ATPase subunit
VTAPLAVETDALRKRYGDAEALCGVDLGAPQGSVLGVLGPNGAGKTPAVPILTTPLRADAGAVRVAGFDVMRKPARVPQRIGLGRRSRSPSARSPSRDYRRVVSR